MRERLEAPIPVTILARSRTEREEGTAAYLFRKSKRKKIKKKNYAQFNSKDELI